jgi:hypothetical protein
MIQFNSKKKKMSGEHHTSFRRLSISLNTTDDLKSLSVGEELVATAWIWSLQIHNVFQAYIKYDTIQSYSTILVVKACLAIMSHTPPSRENVK